MSRSLRRSRRYTDSSECMRPISAVAVSVASVFIGVVIANASGNGSVFGIAECVVLSAPTVLFIFVALHLAGRLKKADAARSELVDCLRLLMYHMENGVPFASALGSVADAHRTGPVARAFRTASRKARLGYDYQSALSECVSQCHGWRGGAIKEGAKWDEKAAVHGIIEVHERASIERMAGMPSAMQRYATISMFISTIAPSFLLFGFVGSMIISGKAAAGMLLSVLLLLAVPAAYSAVNIMMQRKLHELG